LNNAGKRIFGVLADYPDQNDHDVLRGDPIFKLVAGAVTTFAAIVIRSAKGILARGERG